MASQTIFGYFGKKGAGKTHELLKVILDRLREGRHVVAVIPQIDVHKVAKYLDDPTVLDRLVVCGEEDMEKPNFWPDDRKIRDLQLWKRDTRIPSNAYQWRESIVLPGSFVVIDEAWIWLNSEKSLKESKGLDVALRKARHWQGPKHWNDPELLKKYEDPLWFPMMGGPDYEEIKDASGKKIRIHRGGDGTPLVTTNILFASQDYHALARSLRAQIDQSTLLVAIDDSAFPELLKQATDGLEQYKSYTFEKGEMPTRQQMINSIKKKDKLWFAEALHTHQAEIHDLYNYSTGYVREQRVDEKVNLADNPEWRRARFGMILLLVGMLFAVGAGFLAYNMLGKTKLLKTDKQQIAAKNTKTNSTSTAFAGRIGNTVVVEAGGQMRAITDQRAGTGSRYPSQLAQEGQGRNVAQEEVAGNSRFAAVRRPSMVSTGPGQGSAGTGGLASVGIGSGLKGAFSPGAGTGK